ncbi:MAG: TonB family protein, partial [Acidobacteria bacterium]|nr:TonB family protein [Acidobacteriota bacterium]
DVAAPDSPSNASGNVTPSTSTVEEFTIAAGSPAAVASRLSPSTAIAAVWLAGTVIGIVWLMLGLRRLRRVRAGAREDSNEWRRDAQILGERLGLRHPVRVLHGSHPALLIAWGWRTPTILLPSGAEHWHDDRRRVVLAHELAHLARGDWSAQLAGEVLRTLYWFNPLTWIACRWLRLESECACDDHVLAEGISAPDYATHLLDIARTLHAHRHPALPAPAMARPTSLEGRVRAMLNHRRNRRPLSSSLRQAIIVGGLALTLLVAGARAQAQFYPVTGTIIDPTNRVLPNVQVSLADRASQARYEVRTDSSGRYTFAGVPVADYTLEARTPGFAPSTQAIRVEGQTTRDLRMEVGTLEETITVKNAPPDAGNQPPLAQRRAEALVKFEELAERAGAPCRAAQPPAVGGNIFAPRKLLHVTAVYPESLRNTATGGIVTMKAVIGTDGTVRDIQALEGPHPELEAAAADAVRQWQFSATYLNCEPIEVQMKVTTNFVPQ